MRVFPNGDIFYPHKGVPPSCPEGYERDPGDPFLFHYKLTTVCKYRTEKEKHCKCGTPLKVAYCSLKETFWPACKDCTDGIC